MAFPIESNRVTRCLITSFRAFLSLLFFCIAAIALLCTLLVFFSVGNKPDLEVGWSPAREDLIRAKKILHEGARVKPDEIGVIELTEADLNLAANYLLNRYSKSAAHIELKNNKLRFMLTMSLPDNRFGKFVNISFRLGNTEDYELPVITKFKAGKLLLPAKLAAFLIDNMIRHTSLNDYFILATRPIHSVKIDSQKVTIAYYSSKDTFLQARNFLTHASDNSAVNAYQQKLQEVIANHDPKWRLSLADLLRPLFALAYQRSTLTTAIDENRMVISVINTYMNQEDAQRLLSGQPKAPEPEHPVFLYKRTDLAQHFIASAELVVSVNKQAALIAGEEKEINDSQGGSGFSFIDLSADKAGIRFGDQAISSPENARKIQLAMSQIKDYSDFMPDPTGLPENLSETEFKQRYESLTSPAYLELMKDIDNRISLLTIYRND